uniref:CSP2 n=1 Tax=Episyrphus balteatus TaxID=286459 RepID=A0A6H0D3B0_EPIBA|nr:CSP2 [Episyrphus balteatus]
MKVLIVAMLAVTIAIVAAEEKYTTKYDSIDIEEILKSDRLFKNYFNCLMESGKCTPDGRELKRVLPDALKTGCAKCSEKQRAGTERVLKFIIENKPEQWKALQAKYDPDGVYFKKYENEAKQLGVKA